MKFLQGLSAEDRRTVKACFFAFFFNGLFTLMMGSLMPDMKAAYHLTDTQSGLMLSSHSAGNLAAGFLSGLAPLYLGRRKSIMCLCSLVVIGFTMTLLYGNPVWLVVAFLLTGIGRGSVSNFNNGTVTRATNGNPAASIMLHCFFAVGALSAPLIFLLSSRLAGWRMALGVIIALGALVVLNFSRLHLSDDRPDRKDKTQSSMVFVKNRSFLIFAGMMFFYLCAEYSVNGWLVTYLQNKPALLSSFAASGQNAETALVTYSQTMATLLWGIILVGRLVSMALSKRMPQQKLLLAESLGVVLFFVLLLLGNSVALVTVAVAGLGLCMAGICPMIYSNASFITNVYPMGTSTLLALGSIGGILMPTIVGLVADRYGFGGGMASILIGVAALALLSALNWLLPPKQVTPPAVTNVSAQA